MSARRIRLCSNTWPGAQRRDRRAREIALAGVAQRDEFDASHPESIAGCQSPCLDPFPVDEGAVGTVEVPHLKGAVGGCRQPAVHPRDEGGVHDKVRARGSPYRSHTAGQNTERLFSLAFGNTSQNPHIETFRPRARQPSWYAQTSNCERTVPRRWATVSPMGAGVTVEALFKGWAKPGPVPPGAHVPIDVPPDETLDAISGHFRIFQLRGGHRFSTDDLLTAWYGIAWAPSARSVLDLGSGVGSVGMMAA